MDNITDNALKISNSKAPEENRNIEEHSLKSISEDDNEDSDIELVEEDTAIEYEYSDEEIYSSRTNLHRALSSDGMKIMNHSNFGRKSDYHLLTNNETEQIPITLTFSTPLCTIWIPTPMSPARRAFFIASIMFGVLVVAMFLWALPCDVQPCDQSLKVAPKHWFREIDHIGVNFTKLLEKVNGDLGLFISFYSEQHFIDEGKNKTEGDLDLDLASTSCGFIRLTEKTGKERWRMMLNECPRYINCDLMDATGDGLPDCLILGHKSMALMFEPIYGNIFWHIHVHTGSNDTFHADEYQFDLPLTLHDLDGDGFLELLFPCFGLPSNGFETKEESHLVLVSGRTGAIIGKPYTIASCQKIIELYREDVSLGYSCHMRNRSELRGKIPLTTLLSDISKNFELKKYSNNSIDFGNDRVTPEINEAVCQLKYINEGICPYCKTSLQLGVTLDNPKVFEYSTISSWKVLSVGNVCKGVLFKLWKWDENSLQEAFIEKVTTNQSPSMEETARKQPEFTAGNFDYKGFISGKNIDDEAYNDNSFPDEYDIKKTLKNRREIDNTNEFLIYGTHSNSPNDQLPPLFEHNDSPRLTGFSNVNRDSTTSFLKLPEASQDPNNSSDNIPTVPPSSISPPIGYHLQKVEEALVLMVFNGSNWFSQNLGSVIIYQLCRKECIPSHLSQRDTVVVDMNTLQSSEWNIYASSSTFSSYKGEPSQELITVWSLQSYIRKVTAKVSTDN